MGGDDAGRDRKAAARREYYRRHREEILAKKREQHLRRMEDPAYRERFRGQQRAYRERESARRLARRGGRSRVPAFVPDVPSISYAMRRAGLDRCTVPDVEPETVDGILAGRERVYASTMMLLAEACGCEVSDLMRREWE